MRPEDVRLVDAAEPGSIRGEVYVVEPTGNETLVEVLVGDERLTARASRDFDAAIGSAIGVELNAATACFFDGDERCVAHRLAGGGRPLAPADTSTTEKEEAV